MSGWHSCAFKIANNSTGNVTVTLNDAENAVWSGNTTAAKEYLFTIDKATPVVTVTTDKPSGIAGKTITVTAPMNNHWCCFCCKIVYRSAVNICLRN